jgi:chorismate dehydratase
MFRVPRLRISAISFLNTAPLMWDFDHDSGSPPLRRDFEIHYTVPSACAEALRAGTADIGIIPAITYQTIPDLVVIPDVAIGAKGPVRSILFVSKHPLAKIKTVAADTSSRTSVALLKIIFRKWWRPNGEQPEFVAVEPDLKKMLKQCNSALLIGDPALKIDPKKYETVIDLGEEWHERTGLPFVFAFWAVRRAALKDNPLASELPRIFQQSRDHGLENVAALAREWAPRASVTEQRVKDYLTKDIDFALAQEELKGLYAFYKFTREVGLIKEVKRTAWLGGSMGAGG